MIDLKDERHIPINLEYGRMAGWICLNMYAQSVGMNQIIQGMNGPLVNRDHSLTTGVAATTAAALRDDKKAEVLQGATTTVVIDVVQHGIEQQRDNVEYFVGISNHLPHLSSKHWFPKLRGSSFGNCPGQWSTPQIYIYVSTNQSKQAQAQIHQII